MSDDTMQQGYRLETLEVFNWGTFNGLYRLQTDTHTALLTGKNGSGKSTLVDALLTLLVPSRGTGGRNYNQAAGTSGKERNETSYVRGAYTQRTDPTTGKTQTQYLRDEKSYSVLLAVFYNPALDKTVTLAIVFWMSSGSLSKFYVVADRALTYLEHFRVQRDIGRTLKRALRNMDDVQVFNTFTQYSATLTRKLHLGDKAITLFNQIVSIKDIAGLNDFVRQHMLEEYDSQKAIDDLRGYYDNLTTAYEAIEKAEKQLAYLDPLLNVIRRHSDQQGRIIETNEKIDAVEIYISAIQRDLLAVEIKALEEQIQEATIAAEKTAQALTSLNEQRRELERDIDKNDMGQRLQRLKDALKDLQRKQSERQRQQQKYAKSARGVDLTVPDSVLTFDKNRELAQNKLHIIKDEIDDLVRKRVNIRVKLKELKIERSGIEDEIQSLRKRKNQIPKQDVEIRERLLRSLQKDGIDVSDTTFPFVGELLKVSEDYADWEPAIQRLLGGFGRQLLVPEKYYFPVSESVERLNLKGRLVYQRVKETRVVSEDSLPENALFHRLQIKTDTGFTDWLCEKLIYSYSYICADDLSSFHRATRAITINGQVKHGNERHEKDDRFRLGDISRYVLGWENEAKIHLLESQLRERTKESNQWKKRESQISSAEERLSTQQGNYEAILFFDSFTVLDVASVSQERTATEQELGDLQSQVAESQLAMLQEQLDALKKEIVDKENKQREQYFKKGGLQNELKEKNNHMQQVEQILSIVDTDAMSDVLNKIHDEILETFNAELTLANSREAERKLQRLYKARLERQRRLLNDMENDAIRYMKDFKSEFRVETQDVDASLESSAVKWYQEKYRQLKEDDLPRYKAKFNELVRHKITTRINMFQADMRNRVNEYQKRIDNLNESLKEIKYTSETYIQLTYERTKDQQIRAFEVELANCFPNVNRDGDRANEVAYLRIRDLLNRLDEETYWARKVTDVRNWLDFAADERRKSDDSQQERYEGASGKSGGQKAKLAYTIMASAIAYQYGIFEHNRKDSKTFRFVVVDEVFSKSDESNSRFAMDLFRELGLQVLVVTPSDKIHIVEPYIGICHWVKNNDEGNNSRVMDITIEQLREQRAQIGAAD